MSVRPSTPQGRDDRAVEAQAAHAGLRLLPLKVQHLDAVVQIENDAYPFPWSRGNFIDSLAAGYEARGLFDANDVLVGYLIAMPGVDEMHLLNITVAPGHQRQGYARYMLDELVAIAGRRGDEQLWLEVRPSNTRARELYVRYGFRQVGMRKAYYPAAQGRREDALVMTFVIGIDGMLP